jgi:hypothetical protein
MGHMFRDINTADEHGTGGGPEIAGEDSQDRALARAVGSEQANDIPLFDGEGYATHGQADAIALHKALDYNNVRLRHVRHHLQRGTARAEGHAVLFTFEQLLSYEVTRRILASACVVCIPRRHAP